MPQKSGGDRSQRAADLYVWPSALGLMNPGAALACATQQQSNAGPQLISPAQQALLLHMHTCMPCQAMPKHSCFPATLLRSVHQQHDIGHCIRHLIAMHAHVQAITHLHTELLAATVAWWPLLEILFRWP